MGILIRQTLWRSLHHCAFGGRDRGVISLLQNSEALVDGFISPLAGKELYGPVSNVFALHLSHCTDIVLTIKEADEAVAFAFVGLLVFNDFAHLKACELLEGVAQDVVGDLVSEVAAIYSKVVFWPISKTVVHPLLISRFPENFQLSFVFVRDYQVSLFILRIGSWLNLGFLRCIHSLRLDLVLLGSCQIVLSFLFLFLLLRLRYTILLTKYFTVY